MPGFDGSGNYTLNFTFATEAASPPIAISKLDTEFAGIAAGLSLAILRNGNGKPTANIDWNAQKITNLGNATADGDALNRVTADGRYAQAGAAATITGAWTFTGQQTISNTFPAWLFLDTELTETTGKRWYVGTANDQFLVYRNTAASGDFSTYNDVLSITTTQALWMGNQLWHAGNDGSGSGLDADTVDGVQASALAQMSSGSFTVSLRETSPTGTVIDTGTAYWKKAGDVVTLRLPPALWATSTATNFYLTGLPAEIRVGAIGGAAGPTLPVVVTDNGTVKIGYVVIDPQTDRMSLSLPPSGFTGSSGNKGIDYAATLTYAVED